MSVTNSALVTIAVFYAWVTFTISTNDFRCPGEGWFCHPRGCNQFYQCVPKSPLAGIRIIQFQAYLKACPKDTIFSEAFKVCVHSKSSKTKSSRPKWIRTKSLLNSDQQQNKTSEELKTEDLICTAEGFFKHPSDCSKFFRCLPNGKSLSPILFSCPPGTTFDQEISTCNFVNRVRNSCGVKPVTTVRRTNPCPGSGFFRNPEDKTKFYHCYGLGSSLPRVYSCEKGKVFDETERKCVLDVEEYLRKVVEKSSTNQPFTQIKNHFTPDCKEDGFYRSSENCSIFVRCFDTFGLGSKFTAFVFSCLDGSVFDVEQKICTDPKNVPQCSTSAAEQLEYSKPNLSNSILSELHVPDLKPIKINVSARLDHFTTELPEHVTNSRDALSTGIDFKMTTIVQEKFETQLNNDQSVVEPISFNNNLEKPLPEASTKVSLRESDEAEATPIHKWSTTEMLKENKDQIPVLTTTFHENRKNFEFPVPSSTEPTNLLEISTQRGQKKTEYSMNSPPQMGIEEETYERNPKILSVEGSLCKKEGFFRYPKDSSKFYRCIELSKNRFQIQHFSCPPRTVFDEENLHCNFENLTKTKNGQKMSSALLAQLEGR